MEHPLLTILVLMAGRGTRTKELNNLLPKPLLQIHGIKMIEWVISNFQLQCPHEFIFVVQKKDSIDFQLKSYFHSLNITHKVVELDGPNEGAVLSALSAESWLKGELLILNSDQYVNMDMNLYIDKARHSLCDGMILTMKQSGPKWSYIKLDENKNVIEVAEKKEISDIATVGAYWFKNGKDFVDAARAMVSRNDRVNNEFYIAPTYNYLIEKNKIIKNLAIEEFNATFYGLGTTEDIKSFSENKFSLQLANQIRNHKCHENNIA